MKNAVNAISWFEIPSTQLNQAQAFYETIFSCRMQRVPMGPSEGAVFPYAGNGVGVGGVIMAGPTAPKPSANGVLIYLDVSPSLDAVLARVTAAGGQIVMPRFELPLGRGFIAHITDLDGNRVGLHALN